MNKEKKYPWNQHVPNTCVTLNYKINIFKLSCSQKTHLRIAKQGQAKNSYIEKKEV